MVQDTIPSPPPIDSTIRPPPIEHDTEVDNEIPSQMDTKPYQDIATEIDNAIPLIRKTDKLPVIYQPTECFFSIIIDFFVKIIAKLFKYRSL
jgi:hypothetical protein